MSTFWNFLEKNPPLAKLHALSMPLSGDDLATVVGGKTKMPNPLKGAKPSKGAYAVPPPRVIYKKNIGWL